jgi:hypothetical protein
MLFSFNSGLVFGVNLSAWTQPTGSGTVYIGHFMVDWLNNQKITLLYAA